MLIFDFRLDYFPYQAGLHHRPVLPYPTLKSFCSPSLVSNVHAATPGPYTRSYYTILFTLLQIVLLTVSFTQSHLMVLPLPHT